MKTKYLVILSILALFAIGAAVVTPGKKVSEYPNIAVPDDKDMFLMARTNIATPTNANHQYGQLFTRVTNVVRSVEVWTNNGRFIYPSGTILSNSSYIAFRTDGSVFVGTNEYLNHNLDVADLRFPTVTTLTDSNEPPIHFDWTSANGANFANYSSINSDITAHKDTGLIGFNIDVLLTNGVEHIVFFNDDPSGTSGGTQISLQTNGVNLFRALTTKTTNTTVLDVARLATLYGGLAIPGFNAASNIVWTCTNATTGEGEWRTFSGSGSGGVQTNGSLFAIQKFPNDGSVWYPGTNGIPDTNGQRGGALEFLPSMQALSFGALDNNNSGSRFIGAISNWWNPTNMGFGSIRFGSNSLNQSEYASVLGGQFNQIANKSPDSAIVSGTNNWISTNAAFSFIGGGSGNLIQIGGTYNTIGGGIDNEIIANATQGFIGGGNANSISDLSITCVIGGGSDNDIRGSGGSFGFIGGGQQNKIQSASSRSAIVGGDGNQIGESSSTAAVRSFIGGGQKNWIRGGSDQSVIIGGFNNIIFNSSPNSSIGGGWTNSIGDSSGGSVISGGVSNLIGNASSNCIISGGSHNIIADSSRNSFILGTSNVVTVPFAGAIGFNISNSRTGTVAIGNSITVPLSGSQGVVIGNANTFFTSVTVAGSGNGNTNYTLQAIQQKMNLGSSNVNIVAVMQTTVGQSQRWRVAITNDSPDTWGFSASSTTNRWFWQSYMYGTNAPVVLTNNTRLVIDAESEGTNTWAEYKYYSPAK